MFEFLDTLKYVVPNLNQSLRAYKKSICELELIALTNYGAEHYSRGHQLFIALN
jgi:hypothetical protein